MQNGSRLGLEDRVAEAGRNVLDEVFREGARRMLIAVLEAEVQAYVDQYADERDGQGRRVVVRNGRKPTRTLQSGTGPVEVSQPRVNDRREGHRFQSAILPPYLRRTPSLEGLIPWLYLKGVSTNDFSDALKSLLGEGASGLSANTITRLKAAWQEEFKEWSDRDLTGKRYVYLWADGIYFNVRLTAERPCLLVVVGTLQDGTKELVAIQDGERESKLSWVELLSDLKKRGLDDSPKLAVGDGALGFWSALEEVFPQTRQQRCWVHKTANILDKLPKKLQAGAKKLIHEMYLAACKKDARAAFKEFCGRYQAKYPKAVECLVKDQDTLFTFYDFPAEHWQHIRSTNVIESTFATVRHRHRQTKGCGSRSATLAMVFKLGKEAEKRWRRINAHELLEKVVRGVKFEDGVQADVA